MNAACGFASNTIRQAAMKTITLFAFVLVSSTLLVSASLPPEPHETAGWIGTNYTPAYYVSAPKGRNPTAQGSALGTLTAPTPKP